MMIHFAWAIVAFFIGSTFGFFTAGLCAAAAQNDREDEERWRKNNL